MSWRTVVISNNAKLDYQLGYMVVRRDTVVKVHLSEINVLIIESTAVSLTGVLLSELTKRKIKVIFCDEKRNPSSELVSYYGSHDTSDRIRKQVSWSDGIKTSVWTEIVKEKISKQAEVLDLADKKESAILHKYIDEIVMGDKTNREGHAAKVYFNALFGKDFSRNKDSFINAALNYGYGILMSSFAREITASGYITQIGLFHDNMFNQFNFASDLMEPYRPLIDKAVYEMELEEFGKDEKRKVLSILSYEVKINEKMEVISNAVKIYSRSIFGALNEEDISLIRNYEL